ncbi:hypothetical protein ICW40_14345 [Actinotalea ferrariae]|uniref:hypothetical protein n=1 Tax=Actinotalea ferrariae TaxID=1386098 RepID=UPI001C8BCF77|nr:hypothetical protein [Actinotalea ferrariae]MBX9245985.1 hypothetical protein [Actinotalea ferrariae]
MAAVAYGSKVHTDDATVRYTFSVDPAVPEGEVVIPVDDVDGWRVDGREDKPSAARYVVMKAYREWSRTGEWPERVAFQS